MPDSARNVAHVRTDVVLQLATTPDNLHAHQGSSLHELMLECSMRGGAPARAEAWFTASRLTVGCLKPHQIREDTSWSSSEFELSCWHGQLCRPRPVGPKPACPDRPL